MPAQNTASATSITRQADPKQARSSWRDVLPIHPAAEKFPLMSPDELDALGEDIKANGLKSPIALLADDVSHALLMLDGRNRCDSMERAGISLVTSDGKFDFAAVRTTILFSRETDPDAYVVSANIRRRHLDAETRQNILIDVIARSPTKSDRQLGRELGVDHKTVGSARAKGEDVGSIPHVEARTDTRGRKQPARKPPSKASPEVKAAADRAERRAEENRRQQAADADGANVPAQQPEPAKRKSRKRRWQVLPPEGQGECDYDPETEPAFEDDTPRDFRRNAAVHQEIEAGRLAREYALLRAGTQPEEITQARRRQVKAVAAAWRRLVVELEKRRNESADDHLPPADGSS
jgi:hypothetical protein